MGRALAVFHCQRSRSVTQKTFNRLTLLASLAVFIAAVYVLYANLRHIRLADIAAELSALPAARIASALLLTVASYVLLTGYDYLGLRYVGRMLPFRQFGAASFIAFAVSHNLGLALASGGSVRYRLYSGFGLGAGEIGQIVIFCAFTYALGITSVGGLVLSIDPADVAPILGLSSPFVRMAGIGLLALGLCYVGASVVLRNPIMIGKWPFRVPSYGSCLAQIALASVDLALAAAVVYVLLPADATVTYRTFLGIFVLAAAASVLSHVPGGLGVFEAVIVAMLPDVATASSMSALVAFRCIYFLLPLALATAAMALYEVGREERVLGWFGRILRRRRNQKE
jgi:phosphatidylglycerol lysyltransferase